VKPSIMIATPMFGGKCHAGYMASVLSLCLELQKRGWNFYFHYISNESLITRARNNIANFFLSTEMSHLFFVDADIVFNPQDVIKMIEEDKDILCGAYPFKDMSNQYVFNVAENQQKSFNPGDSELKEIIHGGTGYMLIKRRVFDQLKNVVTEYLGNSRNINDGETLFAFFETPIDSEQKIMLSEDYDFCNKWTKCGGKIFLAPYAMAQHIGNYNYGQKFSQ